MATASIPAFVLMGLVTLGLTAPAGQTPAQAPRGSGSAPTQAPAKPAPPETYTYDPDARRDPFVSLLLRGSEPQSSGRRTDGVGGLSVGEIALRGIIESRSVFVAMVQAPDGKTYLLHAGDRLLDGTVKAITAQTLIMLQDVRDPLSLVKQREVRKSLRMIEEPKDE